jgi:hypothetical protein
MLLSDVRSDSALLNFTVVAQIAHGDVVCAEIRNHEALDLAE